MKICRCIQVGAVLLGFSAAAVGFQATSIPKPTSRTVAEYRDQNIGRYDVGGFHQNSPYHLGVMVEYDENGANVISVTPGGAADAQGIHVGDIIMEIDGCPVGQMRGRIYELWKRYQYSKNGSVELLICFVDNANQYRYYYLPVKLDGVFAAAPAEDGTEATGKPKDEE